MQEPARGVLVETLRSETAVAGGVRRLIEACEQRAPSAAWRAMAAHNVDEDVARLDRWLRKVFAKDPPHDDIAGLYFGMYPSREPDRLLLYLSGRDRFDAARVDASWACGFEFVPTDRYADSHLLRHWYSAGLALDDGARRLVTHGLCFGFVALAIGHLMRTGRPEAMLGKRAERHVTVGFDKGEVLWLGTLTPAGWRPRLPS